jgi:hypothetical protein
MLMFRRLVWIVVGLFVTGCASTQLNYNTADLASSLGSLMKSQIFYNLAQALTDPEFVPSQATISIGTAQTINAVNPTLTLPLGPTITMTNRFIQRTIPAPSLSGRRRSPLPDSAYSSSIPGTRAGPWFPPTRRTS